MNTFKDELAQHCALMNRLDTCNAVIEEAANLLCATLQNGGKILLCGNGGSAADCQHIAAEFVVRYQQHRRALPAIALTTDSSILTAHSNDYQFDSVFARQIEALGNAGDCLIALSTSGNSPNIVCAAQAAQQKGLSIITMSGEDGGKLAPLATLAVRVPSSITARIQEAHILIAHFWCGAVEQRVMLAEQNKSLI